jgi:hypothetical protein
MISENFVSRRKEIFFMKRIALTIFALAASAAAQTQPLNAYLFSNALADNQGPYTAAQLNSIKFADVSGDGYPDLCYLDSQGVKCAIYSNNNSTGGSFGSPQLWLPMAGFATDPTTDQSYWGTLQFGDINGDGAADLCVRGRSGFYCYPSTGGSNGTFTNTNMKAGYFSDFNAWNSAPSYWQTIKLVDVNHDGKMDVCGRWKDGIYCQLSMGTIWGTWSRWSADYGDNQNWNSSAVYWSTIQFADLNGDGYPDVCGRGAAGIVCSINNASQFNDGCSALECGFVNNAVWTTQFSDTYYWNQSQYYPGIHFADINGDGKADVCGRGTAGVYCGISQSTSFGWAFNLNEPDFSDANGWNQPAQYEKTWLIDVNGDGKADFCGRGSQGIFCAISGSSGSAIQFAPGQVWINNFGDIYGWNSSASYWGTVQPIQSTSRVTAAGQRMVGFCGRGYAGIWCSVHFY